MFLQVDGWQPFLAVATATALITVGVRFATSQKWALWMGLAILTELVMRLVLEALWRKTDFGRFVPHWLARQTWWNSEYVHSKSGPYFSICDDDIIYLCISLSSTRMRHRRALPK